MLRRQAACAFLLTLCGAVRDPCSSVGSEIGKLGRRDGPRLGPPRHFSTRLGTLRPASVRRRYSRPPHPIRFLKFISQLLRNKRKLIRHHLSQKINVSQAQRFHCARSAVCTIAHKSSGMLLTHGKSLGYWQRKRVHMISGIGLLKVSRQCSNLGFALH